MEIKSADFIKYLLPAHTNSVIGVIFYVHLSVSLSGTINVGVISHGSVEM
jgi:hypothetical protein